MTERASWSFVTGVGTATGAGGMAAGAEHVHVMGTLALLDDA
jgi:hypothetical protein